MINEQGIFNQSESTDLLAVVDATSERRKGSKRPTESGPTLEAQSGESRWKHAGRTAVRLTVIAALGVGSALAAGELIVAAIDHQASYTKEVNDESNQDLENAENQIRNNPVSPAELAPQHS